MSNGWAGLHRKEALNLKWWAKKTRPSGDLEKLNSWHVHRANLIAYIFFIVLVGRDFTTRNLRSLRARVIGCMTYEHEALVEWCWYEALVEWCRCGEKERLYAHNATQQRSHYHSCHRKQQNIPFVFWDTCSQQHKPVSMETQQWVLFALLTYKIFPTVSNNIIVFKPSCKLRDIFVRFS
jgi:nitrate reductase NapE component